MTFDDDAVPGEDFGVWTQDLCGNLARLRTSAIERRLEKLQAAGFPLERVSIMTNSSCRCRGMGVVLEYNPIGLVRGRECPNCLGVVVEVDQLPTLRR